MGWLFLLHPRIGMLNQLFQTVFGIPSPFSITTILGMGWVQGLNLAPLAFIMTAAVFRSWTRRWRRPPGARRGATARAAAITVRLAWPGIMAASIYVFMTAFAAFDVPAIIGWGNRIFTFSTYLYLLLNPQDVLPQYGLAAALSTIALVIAALASWWYGLMQQRSRRFAVVTGSAYRPKLAPLGRRAIGAWCFIGAYLLLSKIMPILLLAYASGLPYFQLPSALAFSTISLSHYATLPWDFDSRGQQYSHPCHAGADGDAGDQPRVLWVVLRSRIPGRAGLDFIAFLPHAVPSIIFGVGALLLTLFVLQRALPLRHDLDPADRVRDRAHQYGTRMTNSGLIQIHAELESSALMSGASTWDAFRRVTCRSGTDAAHAWLWIALLTFRELTLAVILSTSDNLTFPVVVWSLWLGGGLVRLPRLRW